MPFAKYIVLELASFSFSEHALVTSVCTSMIVLDHQMSCLMMRSPIKRQ